MKTCSVSKCSSPVVARGWCSMHYQRWYLRGGDPTQKLKSGRKSEDLKGEDNPNWAGGKSKHPLIEIYRDMVRRCHNENHPRYDSYGGRGIQVSPEWRENFWSFVAHVGDRPEGKSDTGRSLYSLDRINNDGNYEPGNVRWATNSEQAKNKRGYGDFESRRDATTGRFT